MQWMFNGNTSDVTNYRYPKMFGKSIQEANALHRAKKQAEIAEVFYNRRLAAKSMLVLRWWVNRVRRHRYLRHRRQKRRALAVWHRVASRAVRHVCRRVWVCVSVCVSVGASDCGV